MSNSCGDESELKRALEGMVLCGEPCFVFFLVTHKLATI
jgi:hypothetical protein